MTNAAIATTTTTRIKTPSMWKVILINDSFTPIDFVVEVLVQIFCKSRGEAEKITLAVHEQGKAVVGSFTKDVAVTKVNMVTNAAERFGHPLMTVAEEA